MGSYIGTFRRKEIKYRLGPEQLSGIKTAISSHMQLDSFGRTNIQSLYFDTSDNSIICRSLDKPIYKEKLRLRTYGTLKSGDPVFLELKKKYKGVVYKRRIGISYDAAKAFLAGADYLDACQAHPLLDSETQARAVSAASIQISKEIRAFIERSEKDGDTLAPAMLVSCEREALFQIPSDALEDIVSRELRITFDEKLEFTPYPHGGSASLPNSLYGYGETYPLIPYGEVVMEIKAVGAYPLWLTAALDKYDVRPTSFSKYGEAFKEAYSAVPASEHALPDPDAFEVMTSNYHARHSSRTDVPDSQLVAFASQR